MTVAPIDAPRVLSAAEAILYVWHGSLDVSSISTETGVGRFVVAALRDGSSSTPSGTQLTTGSSPVIRLVNPFYESVLVHRSSADVLNRLLEIECEFYSHELTISDFLEAVVEVFEPEFASGIVSGPSLTLVNIFISRAIRIYSASVWGVETHCRTLH